MSQSHTAISRDGTSIAYDREGSGPPVILYWLGSPDAAVTVRANLLVFLIMLGMTLVANYAWHGLITPMPIALPPAAVTQRRDFRPGKVQASFTLQKKATSK